MERGRSGTLGWAAIGAAVLAWDVLAPETLTSAFRRGAENGHTRPLVIGALGVSAAHLMGLIPERADPFCLVLNHIPHVDKC